MDLPQYLVVADNTVVLDGVNAKFMEYLAHLAMLHKLLFGTDLVMR